MSNRLHVEYGSKTILELRNLQDQGHLNLEPGFQRKSVWGITDRRKLIQSILEGYPVPSIFLYRRDENGVPVYDVLDGKQRLETIFMFSGVRPFQRQAFDVKYHFDGDEEPYRWAWKGIEKHQLQSPFLSYKIQVAEVSGDLADIVDLFVRINSTGKALTASEKRHARFYTSPFLKEAERLARRHRKHLLEQRIISVGDVERMKDVELVSELLASIAAGGLIHKKQAVDKAVGNTAMPARELRRVSGEFQSALAAVRVMFPELKTTRFHNGSEFYSLFLVVWEMVQHRLVLNDRERNAIAMRLLRQFSNGVDEVRERQRRAEGPDPDQRMYAEYLLLVQAQTDNIGQRTRRAEMIRGLLAGLFERKDDRRGFSPEQRRMLWNSDEERVCSICEEPLDWSDFQVDHVKAYSRGGKTDLANAALACRSCNASKGAGRNGRRTMAV